MSLLSHSREPCIVLHVSQISVRFLASGFDFFLNYFTLSFTYSLDGLMLIAWEAMLKSRRARTGRSQCACPSLACDGSSFSSPSTVQAHQLKGRPQPRNSELAQ